MKIIKKLWGEEHWIVNQKYCGKLLVLKRGFRCSFHYHKNKDETFYVIRGKTLMEVGEKRLIMKPEDSVHISPGVLHRFTGLTDVQIIEFSTHHEDSDSYRKEPSGRAQLRKAYDYDGVISAGIKAEPGVPIITSRSFEEIEAIDKNIRLNHPIFFNPITINKKNPKAEIEWKIKMINELGIEEYYEDNPEVITKLTKFCPKCHIIKI